MISGNDSDVRGRPVPTVHLGGQPATLPQPSGDLPFLRSHHGSSSPRSSIYYECVVESSKNSEKYKYISINYLRCMVTTANVLVFFCLFFVQISYTLPGSQYLLVSACTMDGLRAVWASFGIPFPMTSQGLFYIARDSPTHILMVTQKSTFDDVFGHCLMAEPVP